MKYPGFYCDAQIDQSSWKFLHLHLVHQKFIVRRSLGQNWYYNQYWTGPPISKAEFHNKIIRRNYPPTRYTRVHGPPLFLVREIITLNISIQYFTFSDKFLLVSSTVLITFKWDHIIIDKIHYPNFEFPILWGKFWPDLFWQLRGNFHYLHNFKLVGNKVNH